MGPSDSETGRWRNFRFRRPEQGDLSSNRVVRRPLARAAILSCVVLMIAADARAQVPFGRYRTFVTPHFIVTFEDTLEDHARRAAARAEAAHALLSRAYGSTLRGRIRLVIVDQGDVFNGSATPVPTNRIVAFAHTPVEDDLFFTDDPIELLVTDELAHVFHLDESRRGWRVLRNVFGRGELTFPLHVRRECPGSKGWPPSTNPASLTRAASAVHGFPRCCARGSSRRTDRTSTKRNPIRVPGRSTATMHSAVSFSIIWPALWILGHHSRLDGATGGIVRVDSVARVRHRRAVRRTQSLGGVEHLDRR